MQILSGHSHNHYTTTIASNITETTFAAVMGAYWYPLCNDGSPRGYGALDFKGNTRSTNTSSETAVTATTG